MIKLSEAGVYLVNGKEIIPADSGKNLGTTPEEARKNTIAYSILKSHNKSDNMEKLNIKFDCMASHDITYVGIIQTARASGLKKFPIPYVLTNCHNSLCAVGGTINEDDHMFGLSAAKKYGGIYVPAHQAVIHQYMREEMAGCGKMILGSDSHTRYGALGTMAIGEGGGELAKQLLNKTYDINCPEVVGVYLTGKPKKGIGPQDIALAIIGAVFKNGYVKNRVMEFVGDGISDLDVEFRNGIDVMTTETTCLSSIWVTDDKVKNYLDTHSRIKDYKELKPGNIAYYDRMIQVDLSEVESMIALPFHPSNVYTIKELNANLEEILTKVEKEAAEQGLKIDLKSKIIDGKLHAEQGIIAGCAGGTYDNLMDVADILDNKAVSSHDFSLSVYPSSQPTALSLVKNGSTAKFMAAGAIVRTAFCGPCFGAGDTPANNQLSLRHTTRNFPSREGSKPGEGQISSVALMDARSIAATAINGGILTPATDLDIEYTKPEYKFDSTVYKNRVYYGYEHPLDSELTFGPNIVDWPAMPKLTDNLLLKVTAFIKDPVTTTDELIPSGEASSFRSNPLKLAEFTLSRRVPEYVEKSKAVQIFEKEREDGKDPVALDINLKKVFDKIKTIPGLENIDPKATGIGSTIYANKPGDGSAREQAASCQKVLGGWANISKEYATKRYRSNLINWGMVPFTIEGEVPFENEDFILIRDIKNSIAEKKDTIKAYVIGDEIKEFDLTLTDLTDEERETIIEGCLINYYKKS
ncbi:hydratase [Ilyobacter polytropus]|uniref:Aconitate hydratase domain protein n=1 Tax=Ilyobacter polytropus (strain ATCC 51220 / DSM 2926 / LMG 16218 / CuHBu1) TaxID=572544 RepID=E3H941_ILYPC|nr:hydratase [Ilyobacter polytropus]ADO82013.1 aconitate hydratase domain protein [Ilyobacter polytropus DSM 2926]